MPALPDVPGVLRVDHHFTIGADTHAKCRMFFKYSGAAPSSSELNTFATALDASWNTNLKPMCNADVVKEEIDVTDLTSPTAAFGSENTARTGTRTGGGIPAQTAFLIVYQVARRYRGGHPRNYWPFGGGNDYGTVQTWESSFMSAVEPAFNQYLTDIAAAGWVSAGAITHVNVSYYHGSTPFTGPTGRVRNISTVRTVPVVDSVVNVVYEQLMATQRRRTTRKR